MLTECADAPGGGLMTVVNGSWSGEDERLERSKQAQLAVLAAVIARSVAEVRAAGVSLARFPTRTGCRTTTPRTSRPRKQTGPARAPWTGPVWRVKPGLPWRSCALCLSTARTTTPASPITSLPITALPLIIRSRHRGPETSLSPLSALAACMARLAAITPSNTVKMAYGRPRRLTLVPWRLFFTGLPTLLPSVTTAGSRSHRPVYRGEGGRRCRGVEWLPGTAGGRLSLSWVLVTIIRFTGPALGTGAGGRHRCLAS